MKSKSRLTLLLALSGAAFLSLAALAGARPTVLDEYCSESGDICQQVVLSKKNGNVKFILGSNTPAVQGEYTLCVKGQDGKECKDFVLEQVPADAQIYEDKVVWQKEFEEGFGEFVVKWKYMGERLGKKLRFGVGAPGEA